MRGRSRLLERLGLTYDRCDGLLPTFCFKCEGKLCVACQLRGRGIWVCPRCSHLHVVEQVDRALYRRDRKAYPQAAQQACGVPLYMEVTGLQHSHETIQLGQQGDLLQHDPRPREVRR